MGRKLKYKTIEEKTISKREIAMRYYWKHVDKRRKAALIHYYKNKIKHEC